MDEPPSTGAGAGAIADGEATLAVLLPMEGLTFKASRFVGTRGDAGKEVAAVGGVLLAEAGWLFAFDAEARLDGEGVGGVGLLPVATTRDEDEEGDDDSCCDFASDAAPPPPPPVPLSGDRSVAFPAMAGFILGEVVDGVRAVADVIDAAALDAEDDVAAPVEEAAVGVGMAVALLPSNENALIFELSVSRFFFRCRGCGVGVGLVEANSAEEKGDRLGLSADPPADWRDALRNEGSKDGVDDIDGRALCEPEFGVPDADPTTVESDGLALIGSTALVAAWRGSSTRTKTAWSPAHTPPIRRMASR